jgi:hypothetical protein
MKNKRDEIDNNLITVSGKELGKYNDFKELSTIAKEYYKANIQGSTVIRDDIGRIDFTGAGIGETIATSKHNPDISKTIIKIREIIKYGKILLNKGKNKIRKDNASFIAIECEIEIEGVKRVATVLIRDIPNGIKSYYTLYLDLDKEKG